MREPEQEREGFFHGREIVGTQGTAIFHSLGAELAWPAILVHYSRLCLHISCHNYWMLSQRMYQVDLSSSKKRPFV